MPFEEVIVLLMTQLHFRYSELMQMRVSHIKIYLVKALEIMEAQERALQE